MSEYNCCSSWVLRNTSLTTPACFSTSDTSNLVCACVCVCVEGGGGGRGGRGEGGEGRQGRVAVEALS